jgi:hypothetical protein
MLYEFWYESGGQEGHFSSPGDSPQDAWDEYWDRLDSLCYPDEPDPRPDAWTRMQTWNQS